MGTIWVAEDLNLGRRVALKFLSEDLSGHAAALERFKFEARAASALNHPNICTIYEIGEADGEFFIAMELVEGESLDLYLSRHAVDLQELLDLAIQIADALDAAHSRGILHRDIKPGNVLVTTRGQVKVLDFGLAKLLPARHAAEQPTYAGTTLGPSSEHLTSPGMAVGTTAFMSPEQARGRELDARSDLFSFGAVLYVMATGKLPFDGPTAAVIFDGILNQAPAPPLEVNPEMPPKLDEIIRTALEKDRDLRYQSAAEMRAELKRLKRDTSSGKVIPASESAPRTPGSSAAAAKPPSSARSVIAVVRPPASWRRRALYFGIPVLAAILVAVVAVYFAAREHAHTFNLANMKIGQVTTSGNAVVSALSPDRRYIVYALRDGAQQSLWVQQLATGSNVQVLAPDQVLFVAVSFTPDGNYIMFVRSDKASVNFRYLYQMPVLGGQPRQLVRDVDSAPVFSPDGQRMVYVRGILNPPGNDILIANTDGSGERLLVNRKGFGAGAPILTWSADGRNLALVSPETRGQTSIWELITISATTGEAQDLHTFDYPARAAAWLPDGSGLLVVGLDPQSGRGQIWFVSYPEGKVSRFTNDLTNYDICCLDLTRDGSALVALQNTVSSDVWLGQADASAAQQLTSGETLGSGLIWVQNRIYASTPSGHWFIVSPDNGRSTPLFADHTPRLQVAACADGKYIFYSNWHSGAFEVWRADADGSNPVKLVRQSVVGGAQCLPDSKSIIYATDTAIWRVPVEGGPPEKTDLPFANFGFSRDGKLRFLATEKVEGGALQSQIVVSRIGGPTISTFTPPFGLTSLQFTPDGKALAYKLTRDRATNIWTQPVSGGPPAQLTHFPSGDIFDFSWSSDGKHLAFSRGQRKTDVIMISNFR